MKTFQDMTDDEFLKLWAGVKNNDADSYEILDSVTRAFVQGYVFRRLKGDFENVVNEVMVNLTIAFQREEVDFRNMATYVTYVKVAARNRCISESKKRTELQFPGSTAVQELLRASGITPSQEVSQKEQSERLVDALLKVEEKPRTVLQRHYFDQMKFVEIAKEMGITEAGVRFHHEKGKLQLRRHFVSLR